MNKTIYLENMLSELNRYCGSKFWNSSLTIAPYPQLTQCFEQTVLVWTPCGFMCLLSIFHFCGFVNLRKNSLKLNNLHIAKLIVAIFIIALMLLQIVYRIYKQDQINESYPAVEFATPSIIIITMVLALVIQIHARLKGQVTSGVLSLFWLLFVVCMLVPFISKIKTATKGVSDMVEFGIFVIFFGFLVLQLILISFAEPAAHEENDCPEYLSSAFSRVFFSWLTPLIVLGYKESIVHKNISRLNDYDRARQQGEVLAKEWEKELNRAKKSKERAKSSEKYNENINDEKKKLLSDHADDLEPKYKPSLTKAMIRSYGSAILASAFFRLIKETLQFTLPVLMGLLINFTEDESVYLWLGFVYAIAMYVVAFIQTISFHQSLHYCFLVGMRLRTGIKLAVYKKSLKISNSARQMYTSGEILNLMSTDAQRFLDLMPYINIVWTGPYVIIIAIWQLWRYIGPSVLAGVAVMVLLIPLNGWIASRISSLSAKNMRLKDKRIKLMSEVLNGIKVLKLYAWEPSFEKQVTKIRNDELKLTTKVAYLKAVMLSVWNVAPFIVTCVSLGTYVLVDEAHVLNSETAFVSLSLFNILRIPLAVFPQVISGLVYAHVSSKRLTKFLLATEIDPNAVKRSHNSNSDGVVINHGTFSWDATSVPVLHNINLVVKKGTLTAVVGNVGSGKSSLISSILGELQKRDGEVLVNGSIAYVPQQAWIQNLTVKENILFGKHLCHSPNKTSSIENNHEYITESRYNRIISTTALNHDLKILPAGDQTEIGEKGINLSGGQKQRVSLARAVCSDSDIYLLDDPLSAVDSHIGKHIFEQVIGPNGMLRKKTRILVTHGIQYLPNVDNIIVMKEGRVTEVGTYNELLERKGDFSKFLEEYANAKTNEEDVDDDCYDSAMGEKNKKTKLYGTFGHDKGDNEEIKGQKLTKEEEVREGTTILSIIKAYVLVAGIKLCVLINLAFILYQVAAIGGNNWLSAWTNYTDHANFTAGEPKQIGQWLGGYGGFGVAQMLAMYLSYYFIATAGIVAATVLQRDMLTNILKAPSHFFDTTPTGRIVNRFAKDVYIVDELIPKSVQLWLKSFYQVLGTLVVIIYATPMFSIVIVPLAMFYYFAQRYYIATSRQLKRLESVSRSPIYSHFGETVSGLHVVRAFDSQRRFINTSEAKVDFNQECYYPNVISNRWLGVRLEIIGNAVVFFAALFAVFARGSISQSLVGLSISYALTITSNLNIGVRQTSEFETNIVSVERIKEYSETENEADWWKEGGAPDPEWPDKGQVVFNNYGTRYRKGLDLVLKNISCNIDSGQKVGIVGRTGAGKSSLTLALFRLIEPVNGTITIDGVDISKIGLHQLRNKLTIIPQDPVLFSGTMRINLDPFLKYSDEQIWNCLEHAHLKDYISGLNAKLEHICAEGGENLSVGQKQLICLSRALLRKTKILILDEATAAVDMQTDDLIQKTIRTEFADCTVITIAHRLNTIMDYDRVLVLEDGRVAEFGSPEDLIKKENVFYTMARDAGLV